MVQKALNFLVIGVFLFYWGITILYCGPDNYLKIQVDPILTSYEKVFYQKWSFFAPPADFNFRLYFEYLNKDSLQVNIYEILKPIAVEKQRKAPFNSQEQFMDYIVNGSVIQINDLLSRYVSDFQQHKKGVALQECIRLAIDSLNNNAARKGYTGFNTLRNYLRRHWQQEVAAGNLANAVYGRMVLTSIKIPRFANRDSVLIPNHSPKEEPVYYSNPIKLSE